jgi:hypothetical protein
VTWAIRTYGVVIRGSVMTPIPESLTDDPPSVVYVLPVRSLSG